MKNLKVAVAVVFYENKIILIKRKKEPFKDLLILPGGKIEQNEPADQASLRELKEETGLEADKVEYSGHCEEIVFENDQAAYHHDLFVYKITPKNWVFQSSKEGETVSLDLIKLQSFKSKIQPTDFLFIKESIKQNYPFEMKLSVEKHPTGAYSIIKKELLLSNLPK